MLNCKTGGGDSRKREGMVTVEVKVKVNAYLREKPGKTRFELSPKTPKGEKRTNAVLPEVALLPMGCGRRALRE